MRVCDLLEALRVKRAREEFLAIGAVNPGAFGQFTIVPAGGVWEVYYTERGEKSSLQVFEDEEIAANYFYEWVCREPMVIPAE